MKRIFVLIFAFLMSFNVCFAQYKPIPANKSKQYKAEVEQIINEEVPKAKQEVYKIFAQAQNAYRNKSIEDLHTYDDFIGQPEYDIHVKIIGVTNNYAAVEKDLFATGDPGALYDFLYPYFKDNNVDLTKLYELINLCGIKQKEIEQMLQSLSNN